MLLEDLLNFLVKWFKTRKWLSIGGLGLLVGALPAAVIYLVIAGMSTSLTALASSYDELLDEAMSTLPDQLVDESDEVPAMQDAAAQSADLRVPLRRLLQMDAANDRVKYFVALELATQGRTSMAARMMREIAPLRGAGYPDAHSWLAVYAIRQRQLGNTIDRNQLLRDLEVAVNQAAAISPDLIVAYAALLNEANRSRQAMAVLRDRRQQFPELNVAYAELASRLNETADFKDAIREGTESLEARFKSGEADPQDILRLVQLALIDGNSDRALAISQTAVTRFPENQTYQALYSSALHAKYLSLDEETDLRERMTYLDAAFKANPANQAVVADVVRAMNSGREMPEDLRAEVEEMLADGNAPSIAHLILANRQLNGPNPESAIAHLELALRQTPNSAIVMNNLAVALLKTSPDETDRAYDLVKQAIATPGSTAEMLAAMLDTQGQVLLAQAATHDLHDDQESAKNARLDAIDSFEKAISLDNTKLNTRQRLADTYQEMGMTDLAAVQRRRIARAAEQESQDAN